MVNGGHVSVLLQETLDLLTTKNPSPLMVDGTLGLAGHSSAFLERYPTLRLIGVDADAEVQAIARARLEPYGDRVRLVNCFFDEFFLDSIGDERPDIILFDFGMSMYHFREARRGFSLQGEEPLDMRLNPSTGRSASELINEVDERELMRVLNNYGEEPFAKRIAMAIVRERAVSPIVTTTRLAEIVKMAVPAKARYGRTHPATRTFQAIRICVNDELGRITRALDAAIDALAPDGVLGAISFHSLEDRIVKKAFRDREIKVIRDKFKPDVVSPIPTTEGMRGLFIVTRKPVEPGEAEVSANPASRSAKLRVARTGPEPYPGRSL